MASQAYRSIRRKASSSASGYRQNPGPAGLGAGPAGLGTGPAGLFPAAGRDFAGRRCGWSQRAGITRGGWGTVGTRRYFKMFTARETTSTATTSEIAASNIIMSLAQDLIAETSVGLKAVAVVNDRCR